MSHARLSPSAAHRWMLCPGSVREEEKYPDSSGDAAIDGTHTHTLLENCLVTGNNPEAYLNQSLTDHEGEFMVDQARLERVQVALGYIYARKTEMGGPVALRAESHVDPGLSIGRTDCTGTADCILVSDGQIEVIDYKDGMVPVSPENNWQMILYTIGVLNEYPGAVFNNVRMTIIQPKIVVKGKKAVNYVDVTMEDLAGYVADFLTYAARTDAPDAELVAGDSQCKWCKAKANCSALAEKAMGAAQVMFAGVGTEIADQSAQQNPNVMTDEKIRETMEGAPLIREFLKAVEAEAFTRLKAGQAIEGLKLVSGRGSRKWNLSDQEMADKLKRMGMPKDVIFPAKLISVAQVSKVKWTKKAKGEEVSANLSERQLKNINSNYVTKSKGSLQVALESDDRQSVMSDAVSLFQGVKVDSPETTEQPALPAWLQ